MTIIDQPQMCTICGTRVRSRKRANRIRKELFQLENFDQFLTDPNLSRHFEAYLTSEYCSDLFYFHRDATRFANTPFIEDGQLEREYEKMQQKYFDPETATYFLTFSDNIMEELKENRLHKNVFEDARAEAEWLLKSKFAFFCDSVHSGQFIFDA